MQGRSVGVTICLAAGLGALEHSLQCHKIWCREQALLGNFVKAALTKREADDFLVSLIVREGSLWAVCWLVVLRVNLSGNGGSSASMLLSLLMKQE